MRPRAALAALALLALLSLPASLAGCADDGAAADAAASGKDSTRADGASDAAVACDAGAYPCGPFGSAVGDVVPPLSFRGYLDPSPDHLCKAPAQLRVDRSVVRSLSFADYYRAKALCTGSAGAAPRLLWVTVAAGWCVSCYAEMSEMQEDFLAGRLAGVAPLSIVFETDTVNVPSTDAFVALWSSRFKLRFPAVGDPSFSMGRFSGRNQVPFNMLVDMSTMRVVYRQTGAGLTPIRAEIADFLAKNK